MRTAEFVSPKHPDKICDRISDTILDRLLIKDKYSQCNIQTIGNNGKVWVVGNIKSKDSIPNEEIQQIVKEIGDIDDVEINLTKESSNDVDDINGYDYSNQGIMIGYATRETPTMMPFEYELARQLNKSIYKHFPFHGKTQLTINGSDVNACVSFQHASKSNLEELVYDFFDKKYSEFTHTSLKLKNVLCNSLGDWYVGGIEKDFGSTGKKIVMDSYGPRIPVGGGSFSGNDCSRINRSATYMARKIAVDSLQKYQLVYALVELSYVVGSDNPVQARIKGNDQGIDIITGTKLYEVDGYDLSRDGIINFLDLRKPQYAQTSEWGHFGNDFSWK